VRLINVSSSPSDSAYREGHLPGAVWWFWKERLWHSTNRELITPEVLAEQLARIGVSPDTTVVLYGSPVQFGTYAFWVLHLAGHRNLKLLDGGQKRWVAEGRSLSRDLPSFPPVAYPTPNPNPASLVGRDQVRAGLGQPGRILLDVRSPEEYRGERVSPPPGELPFDVDHGAERAGRIPGARHLYFRDLVNADDTFLSPERVQSILERAGVWPAPEQELVTYCRLSHRATLAWFALSYLLGLDRVRVYDGSWTEWGSIVGFPIER
jgi:thiosulfate/3-mercaptopyruvate sulfurtransferase